MNARHVIRIVVASIMAAGTFAGSATGLWGIGADAHMSRIVGPLSLVLAMDGLSIVAGLTVHDDRRNAWAWAVLVLATGASAVMQYMAATGIEPLYRAAHAAPPVSALVAFHMAVLSFDPAKAPAKRTRSARNGAGATPAAATVGPPPPTTGVPGSDGDRKAPNTGRQGRSRPAPAGSAPDNAASSLTVGGVVRRLQEADEDCTKAAVMRATGWGSGKALRLMPEITVRYQESNVRPIHKTADG